MSTKQTEAQEIARRLEALAEHLMLQPLTHADSVDTATIRAASTAIAAMAVELAHRDMQLEASAKVAIYLSARFAEANKALEPFAFEGISFDFSRWDGETQIKVHLPHSDRSKAIPVVWFTVDDLLTARRVREGGKV